MRKRASYGQDGKGRRVVAHLKRGMKLVFAGFFVVSMAAFVLVVRLAYGPIAIGGLAPWMEQRIAARIPGAAVRIQDPVLAWRGWPDGFEVRLPALDLEVGGKGSLRLSRLRIALDLFGKARAVEIGRLEGEADWPRTVPQGTADRALAAGQLPAPLNKALDRLVRAMPHRLTIATAHLVLRDDAMHALVEIRNARFAAHRAGRRLALEAHAELAATGARIAAITLVADFRRKGTKSVELTLADARPSRLGEAMPAMAALGGIDLPLDITIAGVADAEGRLTRARLHVTAGAGGLRLAPYYPEPVAIDGGEADLVYDGDRRTVIVDALKVGFAGTALQLAGDLGLGPEGPARLRLDGGFGPLSVRDLVAYWPRTLADGGRDWIDANLQSGRIDGAEVTLDLPALAQKGAAFPANGFHLDFRFSGLLGHYLRPMPPLRDASGSGRLSMADLVLRFEDGMIAGMPIAGSTVRLAGFDAPGTDTGIIDLRLDGPLPGILRLIDYPPLGYATAFGLAPDMIAGTVAVSARITLPLLKEARLDDVDLDLEAGIDDLAIPDIVAGRALEGGRLDMRVDRHGLEATGRARLAGIPLRVAWHERFDAGTGPASRYEIRADLAPDDLVALGLDTADHFAGVARLDLRLTGNGARLEAGALSLDLSRARLRFTRLAWQKVSGAPAAVHAALDFTDPARIRLRRIVFAAGDDRIAGSLSLDVANGALLAADFDRFRLGATDGAIRYERDGAGGERLAFSGPQIDARGLLESFDIGRGRPSAALSPLSLAIDAGTVYALAGERFDAVHVAGTRGRDGWQRLETRARFAGDGDLVLEFLPDGEASTRRFRLEADDAGRAFRALGLFDQAEGGRLEVEAVLAGHGEDLRVDGTARVEDVRLVRSDDVEIEGDAETKSRLDAFLGGSGLHFDRILLPFRLAGGTIDIEGARASGPKLGVTLEGQIDDRLERISVNGLIVPAYWLNSALGRLPLVGGIFSGGKGGGLFAFAYRIKGTTDDPEIRVSTLTGLLPGILRRPFTGAKGKLETLPEGDKTAVPEPPPGG